MDDVGYMGSSSTLAELISVEHRANFEKIIIEEWESRDKANEHEIWLHSLYDVKHNDLFYNKTNASSTGFLFLGEKHSNETKLKISQSNIGKHSGPFSTEHKAKLSANSARKGKPALNRGKKHLANTKKKISKSTKGKNNGMYGRIHSDATKLKMASVSKTYLTESKWYNNGITSIRVKPGTQPPGFSPGRKLIVR